MAYFPVIYNRFLIVLFLLCVVPFTALAQLENKPFSFDQRNMPLGYYVSGESRYYRGIKGSELKLFLATGEDVSYYTRKYGTEKTVHFLNSLGPADIRDLIINHAETSNGYINGRRFYSPLISVTKDPSIAAHFAYERGYILVVKASGAVQNIGGGGREWEFLIPGSIDKNELVGIIGPTDVQKIVRQETMYGKKAKFDFTIKALSQFLPHVNRAGFIALNSTEASKQVSGGMKKFLLPREVSTPFKEAVGFSKTVTPTAGSGIKAVARGVGAAAGIAGTIAAAYDFVTTSPDEHVIKGFYKAMWECAPGDKDFLNALKHTFPLWAANVGFDDIGRMVDKNFDKKFRKEFQNGMAYIEKNCKGVWSGIVNSQKPDAVDFRQGILDWIGRIPAIHGPLQTSIGQKPQWRMRWPTSGFDLVGQ